MSTRPTPAQQIAQKARRRLFISLWLIVTIATVVVLFLFPIRFQLLRLAIVTGVFSAWLGALLLFWRSIPVRAACLAAALAPVFLALLPDKPIDTAALRSEYVRLLRT